MTIATDDIFLELRPEQIEQLRRFFARFAVAKLGVTIVDFTCALRGVLDAALSRRIGLRAKELLDTGAGAIATNTDVLANMRRASPSATLKQRARQDILQHFAKAAIGVFRRIDLDGAGVVQWSSFISVVLERDLSAAAQAAEAAATAAGDGVGGTGGDAGGADAGSEPVLGLVPADAHYEHARMRDGAAGLCDAATGGFGRPVHAMAVLPTVHIVTPTGPAAGLALLRHGADTLHVARAATELGCAPRTVQTARHHTSFQAHTVHAFASLHGALEDDVSDSGERVCVVATVSSSAAGASFLSVWCVPTSTPDGAHAAEPLRAPILAARASLPSAQDMLYWSARLHLLFSCGESGQLYAWDLSNVDLKRAFLTGAVGARSENGAGEPARAAAPSVALLPGAPHVSAVDGSTQVDGVARAFTTRPHHTGHTIAMAGSTDSPHLFSACSDGTIAVFAVRKRASKYAAKEDLAASGSGFVVGGGVGAAEHVRTVYTVTGGYIAAHAFGVRTMHIDPALGILVTTGRPNPQCPSEGEGHRVEVWALRSVRALVAAAEEDLLARAGRQGSPEHGHGMQSLRRVTKGGTMAMDLANVDRKTARKVRAGTGKHALPVLESNGTSRAASRRASRATVGVKARGQSTAGAVVTAELQELTIRSRASLLGHATQLVDARTYASATNAAGNEGAPSHIITCDASGELRSGGVAAFALTPDEKPAPLVAAFFDRDTMCFILVTASKVSRVDAVTGRLVGVYYPKVNDAAGADADGDGDGDGETKGSREDSMITTAAFACDSNAESGGTGSLQSERGTSGWSSLGFASTASQQHVNLQKLEKAAARGRRPRPRLILGDSWGRVGAFETVEFGFRAMLRGREEDENGTGQGPLDPHEPWQLSDVVTCYKEAQEAELWQQSALMCDVMERHQQIDEKFQFQFQFRF
eukprot:g3404.t1